MGVDLAIWRDPGGFGEELSHLRRFSPISSSRQVDMSRSHSMITIRLGNDVLIA